MPKVVLKTLAYLQALKSGDSDAVGSFYADEILFLFPSTSEITSKSELLRFYENEYNDFLFTKFTITPLYIFAHKDTSVMEFTTEMGDSSLRGVQITEWNDNLIVGLRVYINGIHPGTGEVYSQQYS
ncbi:MAG: nuclear transport factor 2 family protein [Myxococcales bacterium]|nr:nuclear transport factor 2 family protein [Myxococcales bacterium]